MSEMERLKFWIQLLEMEVEALRPVLSEYSGRFPGTRHEEFTQWHKAQAIDELKNHLVHP